MKRWIAVVTRTGARFFQERDFSLIAKLDNDLGREKNRAMTLDVPGLGRGPFAKGTSFHRMTGEKNPHEEAAVQFAREVCSYLDKQFGSRRFDQLLVVAEPKMMGRLRGSMSKPLLGCTQWRPKDLGKLSIPDLRRALHREGSRSF